MNSITQLRRSFISRRWAHRLLLDVPDLIVRALTGRGHWPPYSLRSFVGGSDFDDVGHWFLDDFRVLGLLRQGSRILDVGCGCGRVAYAMAVDRDLQTLGICYEGMDIDESNIRWCQRHITSRNAQFCFFHADCASPSYNPGGRGAPASYVFPFNDGAFDLILFISVFTHMLEEDMEHYMEEAARLLAPQGRVYATFFLCSTFAEAREGLQRHGGIKFRSVLQNAALSRADYPTHAVAYTESFVHAVASRCDLRVVGPTRYGLQDLLLFERGS
ncbi:MAG TPA: class I SAM-dependent methyltransferase [Bryobacteraceae bacterium]|nr:class I SAM-dependent methyltransferase [Bryobacteraceae bacterium]